MGASLCGDVGSRLKPAPQLSHSNGSRNRYYSQRDALEELKFWQREASKENKTRPRVASISLSGF